MYLELAILFLALALWILSILYFFAIQNLDKRVKRQTAQMILATHLFIKEVVKNKNNNAE